MTKETLLFLSVNNGSDMRIVKEVKTLSGQYNIIYIGLGIDNKNIFAEEYCEHYSIVKGAIKSPISILKYIFKIRKSIKNNNIKKIHVVDEQLLFLIFPLLNNKHVVLDIFDSIFLKFNKPNNKLLFIKRFLYSFSSAIIVTDQNRKDLLPDFAKSKATVIPNVPFRRTYAPKVRDEKLLTICHFGSLVRDRGSEFALNLLKHNNNIKVICAGWVQDDFTKDLLEHPNVEYLGVRKQYEINDYLSIHGDYLLAIYPTSNINNINASPNKIYDSIQTRTPIIMNEGIRVSRFVKDNGIGHVVGLDAEIDYARLGAKLRETRTSYRFEDKLLEENCWDNYEESLLKLY